MGNVVSDPRNSGEFNKNRESGRNSSLEDQNISKRKQQLPGEANGLIKDKGQQIKKQEPVVKSNKPISATSAFGKPQEVPVRPNKPLNTNSGPGRPPKPDVVQKLNKEIKVLQKTEKPSIQRKPLAAQHDVSINNTPFYFFFSFLVFPILKPLIFILLLN